MFNDPTFYVLAFAAMTPIYWFVGATLNMLSDGLMHTAADGTRSHSALSSLASLLGNLCYLATAAGGLFVAVGIAAAVAVLLLVGGAIFLVIFVPIMCFTLVMSLFLEPVIRKYESR